MCKTEGGSTSDRLTAIERGISCQDISRTLQLALSNQRLGYFTKDGKQYQVIGQVERKNRDDPNDLNNIFVRNNKGQAISLINLLNISEDVTLPSLYHFNLFRSATIPAGLADYNTVCDVLNDIKAIANIVLDEFVLQSRD